MKVKTGRHYSFLKFLNCWENRHRRWLCFVRFWSRHQLTKICRHFRGHLGEGMRCLEKLERLFAPCRLETVLCQQLASNLLQWISMICLIDWTPGCDMSHGPSVPRIPMKDEMSLMIVVPLGLLMRVSALSVVKLSLSLLITYWVWRLASTNHIYIYICICSFTCARTWLWCWEWLQHVANEGQAMNQKLDLMVCKKTTPSQPSPSPSQNNFKEGLQVLSCRPWCALHPS